MDERVGGDGRDPYRRLSPGRSRLGREAIERHQRARLIRAIAELAGERGLAQIQARTISACAGVSSKTFYQHFASKEDGLQAACVEAGEWVFGGLRGLEGEHGPEALRVSRASAVLFEASAADPPLAALGLSHSRALAAPAGETFERGVERLAGVFAAIGPGSGERASEAPRIAAGAIVSYLASALWRGELAAALAAKGELDHLACVYLGVESEWEPDRDRGRAAGAR